MKRIDEIFKDNDPVTTVKNIKGILDGLGIQTIEKWTDSGINNCYSLSLSGIKGIPNANGKGVTKEFARASAYAEFIERLQGGLFYYKYQSIINVKDMNVHSFAPDVKYMTMKELEENGEWMDYIIKEYNLPLTRAKIAKMCQMYACTEEDKILTLPFYSLFEKKYVYLPMGFVDNIYGTNGCCAGNTKEEAWVHAFSEMMERHCSLSVLLSGKAMPKFSDEILNKYDTVSQIIKEIRSTGVYEIDIFDCSLNTGYPVVSARLINKKTHTYSVNFSADPIFEIALQRTLTELFQGRNINGVSSKYNSKILNKTTDFPTVANVVNQLETGSGIFTADYFADEITCDKKASIFSNDTNVTNKDLLVSVLDIYKKLNKPVYVRNFSFLGFHSYRFVVPGFSEALFVKLSETVPEYSIMHKAGKTLRNAKKATKEDLAWLLAGTKIISQTKGRYLKFNRISGTLISGKQNIFLAGLTRSYASFQIGQYKDAIKYIDEFLYSVEDESVKEYFECLKQYIALTMSGIEASKVKSILYKFNNLKSFNQLYNLLDNGQSPYDDFLIECDYENCDKCKYREVCSHEIITSINRKVGQEYKKFINGQNEFEFNIQ